MNKLVAALLIVIIVSSFAGFYSIDKPRETWDEFARYAAGLNYMYNIAHGYFSHDQWELNSGHPPVGKYILGVADGSYLLWTVPGLLHANYTDAIRIIYEYRNIQPGRCASAVMFVLTALLAFMISYKFVFKRNLRVAVMSALILSLLPAFLAFDRLGNLDTSAVFFFTLSIYAFLVLESILSGANPAASGQVSRLRKIAKTINTPFARMFALFVIVTGLAIGSKFTNLTIFIVIPVYIVCVKVLLKEKTVSLKIIIPWILLSYIVLVAVWPFLWSNPVGGFFDSIKPFTDMVWTFTEYFLGIFGGNVGPLGILYYVVYLFVTTPLVLFGLMAAGFVFFIKHPDRSRLLMLCVLIVSFVLVSVMVFKVSSMKYMLLICPFLAIMAAGGLEWITSRFSDRTKWIAVALILLYSAVTVASVSPYYLDYYNEAVGGPKNVYDNRLFIIGYLGEGLDDAIHYINANAPQNSTLRIYADPMHVIPDVRSDIYVFNKYVQEYLYQNGLADMSKQYVSVPGGWEVYEPQYNDTESDYILVNTYRLWYSDTNFTAVLQDYHKVFSVGVEGAEFAAVYELNEK